MTDIASLGLRVESSEAEVAAQRLDKLADAAQGAEQAAGGTEPVFKRVGNSLREFGVAAQTVLGRITGLSGQQRAFAQVLSRLPLPLAAVGGTLGIIAKAFNDGQRESFEFARALALTGRQSGITAGELKLLADRLDQIGGSRSDAVRALTELTSRGLDANVIRRYTAAMQELERVGGPAVSDTAEAFAKLADKPLEAAIKLQEATGFLTPALYEQIRALAAQGKESEAAALAQQAYAAEITRQAQQLRSELPIISRLFAGAKQSARKFWDEVTGVGRAQSAEQRLTELRRLRGSRELGNITGRGSNASGQALADREEQQLARIVAQRRAEAEEIRRAKTELDAKIDADKKAEERAKAAARAAAEARKAQFAFDLGQIKRDLDAAASAYDNYEATLEARRRAGLISEARYYDERRALLEKQTDAQVKALEAENERLRAQGGTAAERIAINNRIADNEAELARVRADAAAQANILAIEEQQGLRDTARAYEDARASAERYLETLQRRLRLETQGIGLGNEERRRLRERADIEERFDEQRRDLDGELRRGEINDDQYRQQLELIDEFKRKALSSYDDYYRQLQEKQGSFQAGAIEALRNYIDEARNVAKATDEAFSSAFRRMEDALVNFVSTGKLNFGDLVRSILADLLRIQLRISLSNVLGSIFGGLTGGGGIAGGSFGGFGTPPFAPPRANGGPVNAGSPYLVGERGPELFVPNASGAIVPNDRMGGGVTINSVVNAGPGVDMAAFSAALDRRDAELEARLIGGIRRGRYAGAGV